MSAPRALLSVTDKTGIVDFARGLADLGFEVVSTGGTARALREAGLDVLDVSSVTGFPEMLDGRVKTLHPNIHGGLLGDVRRAEHLQSMTDAGIRPFQVLCVNLYAFEQTVRSEHRLEDAIEAIDIGGPAMIRAASKNYMNVAVVVDPADYRSVLAELGGGGPGESERRRLAAKAFRHTAYYDSIIARYLSESPDPTRFPEELTLGVRLKQVFRYGENPHQDAALYEDPLGPPGIAQFRQLWGKELSYNNIGDAEGAWELVADLPPNSCAIIKHANPSGAAALGSCARSYEAAREADPVSAFGGIAAFHGTVDADAAAAMTAKGNFLEVVIASRFTAEALQVFSNRSGWGQDARLLEAPLPGAEPSLSFRSIRGGALVQSTDDIADAQESWQVATERSPTAKELAAMELQWTIARHVKSNAIVIGTGERLLGVGAGQMNRVQSVRLALEQAGAAAKGAVLASDAFFPFPDSIEVAAAAGIAAIVQPGGSKKDAEVVAAANRHGLAMCLTGMRHFRH